MTWVWLSVVAALLQNLRSSVQKRLTATLSTNGAASVRFLYGWPFAALYLLALAAGDTPLPMPDARFAVFVLGGSLAQIAATVLLLATFARGSFAVGTTYSKTEGIQVVLAGYLFLGDTVSAGGFGGIVLSVAGVLLLSLARGAAPVAGGAAGAADTAPREGATPSAVFGGAVRERRMAVLLGLLSGAMFALSAVGYRGAALALGEDDFVLRAAFTLAVALGVQSLVTGMALRLTAPGELGRIARAWRWGLLAGASGAAASACWFTAFTLVGAAYVKAVGSVELLFAVATSWLVFRETPTRIELGGIALVLLGVVVTILSR